MTLLTPDIRAFIAQCEGKMLHHEVIGCLQNGWELSPIEAQKVMTEYSLEREPRRRGLEPAARGERGQ